MSDHTIDTAMAKHMVAATAIHGASIIGQPGGWSVMLKLGMTEKPLVLLCHKTEMPNTDTHSFPLAGGRLGWG